MKPKNEEQHVSSEDLYSESTLNIDPQTAFYLNEMVSITLMILSSLHYYLSYDGTHDYFQWQMHLLVWGQTNVFWLIALVYDSELSRMMYFRSVFATAFVPYVGAPIYLLWLIFFHLTER